MATATASAALNVAVEQYTSGNSASSSNGYFAVAAGDLGEAAGAVIDTTGTINTYDSAFHDKYGNPMASVTNLFDGGRAYGGKYATTSEAATFDPDVAANQWTFNNTWCAVTPTPGATVTVTFPPCSGGYNITNIVSLSGWGYDRQVQAYTVAFRTHGSALWTAPVAVSGGTDYTFGTGDTGFHEVRLTLTGVDGGLLASGVDAVRFTFLDTTVYGMRQPDGVSVYREIDIHGTKKPSVQVSVDQYTSGSSASRLNGYFAVAAGDLGEMDGVVIDTTGIITTYAGLFADKYGNPMENVANLFDGGRAYGGKYATTSDAATFDPDVAGDYWTFNNTWCAITPTPGATVTVTFPEHNGGYHISSIVSLSGWGYDRQVQAYTVSFQPHGSALWTVPVTVFGGTDYAFGAEDDGFHEVRLTLTGAGGGLLASGADAVSFTFLDTTVYGMRQPGGVSVYREIDIYGKPWQPAGTSLSVQ
ncbi:MAG TPA: hypothetical protein P5026_05780 [Kiritimatiellia bacterium]|nr:hypothetical protein [Kiritimatiellia bacterium]